MFYVFPLLGIFKTKVTIIDETVDDFPYSNNIFPKHTCTILFNVFKVRL
jgi:hypothetical protein